MTPTIVDPLQEYNDANSLYIREGGALLCVPDEITPSNSVFWQSIHGYYEEEEPPGHFAIISPTTRQVVGFTDLDIDLGTDYRIYHAIYDPVNEVVWAIGKKGDDVTYYLSKFDKEGAVLAKFSFVVSTYAPITYTYTRDLYTVYWTGHYVVYLALSNSGVPHLILYLLNDNYFLANPTTEVFDYVPSSFKFKILEMSDSTAEYVSTVYVEQTKTPVIEILQEWSSGDPVTHEKYFPIIFDSADNIWVYCRPTVHYYFGWWKESTEEYYPGYTNPFDVEDTEPIFVEGSILLDSGGILEVVSGVSTYGFQFDISAGYMDFQINTLDIEEQKYYILVYDYDVLETKILEFDLALGSYTLKTIKLPDPAVYNLYYIPNSTINFINSYQNIFLFLSSGGDDFTADFRVLAYIPKTKLDTKLVAQTNIMYDIAYPTLSTQLGFTGHSKPEVNYTTIENKFPEFWLLVKESYTDNDNYVINVFNLSDIKQRPLVWVST